MEKLKSIITIFLLAVSLLNSTALAKSTSVLLQEGLYAEEVEGNLDTAIKIYQQIIDDSSAQRSHIAQAMYRQGMCYLKEQNELQAKAVFEKLLAQFSEQAEIIDKVKPLLAKIVSPDPAALMPPETLVYFEIGSPGKQIETILNMLKGTPFENPLAAMYGSAASQKSAGGRTPGDIMTALLNPSMVAEFKKIRGMAVGITGIRHNNPPAIAVLYPGESDALRGIILAALGMVAQPGQPIEGMQTVQIQNTAGVAYDDSAIIIAQPLEQLTWCVKQYQGITDEPTLASNNKCFANISRQARQENALTVWANVAQVFTDVIEQFPDEHLPEEIRFADTVIDPKNIDELITYLSIQENRIALEANLAFKEGHRSVAYNMIRTPNLSKDGFQGVPAEAVGLVSIALGEGGGPGVEKARETVENLTGLDIGREIFANIEQITVFAVPSSQSGGTSESGIASLPYLGVAVTSKNPQQTHQILTQILSLADTAATLSENQQSKVAAGKYLLPLEGAQKVYCYVGQAGKTTILAFSPDVLEKSLSTIKSRKSALTAGILQEPLREITPDTSKLALINVGGAIQVADAYLTATHENPQNPGHKMLAQLGQNFNKTFVQLRTRENVDNFNLHVGIDNLPSLNNVFPLLMQLSTVDLTAKVKATQPRPSDGVAVSPKTDIKLSWRSGANAASHKVYFGTEDKIEKMPLLAESKSGEVKVSQLQEGARYFWRVDEVRADGTVITGDVWSFDTGKLVAWWKLDETKGTKASDSSGNNHTGMLVGGPPWQPSGGKVDGALSFDGVDDYVDLTDEMTNLGSALTIVLWAYPTGAGNWARFIDFGNGEYADNIIFARYGTSNDLIFEIYSGSTLRGRVIASDSIDLNQWQCFAATIDDSGNATLYKDGKVITTGITSVIKNIARANNYIGKSNWSSDSYYSGMIDDVRIYNYVLSNEEIEMLCSVKAIKPQPADGAIVTLAEKVEFSWIPAIGTTSHKVYGGTESDKLELLAEVTEPRYSKLSALEEGTTYYWRIDETLANGNVIKGDIWSFTTGKLVGWWKFDETSGTTAYDSSGKGNNGTLYFTGGPNWITGYKDGALQFDPSDGNDYVNLPIGSVINSLSDCTISVWVNWSGQGGAWQRIFDFGMTGDMGHYIYLCPMTGESNAAMRMALVTTYTAQWDEFDASTGALATGWHHVAVTFNESAHTMTMYLDGDVVGSETNCVNRMIDLGDTNRNWLGRSVYPTDPSFNGSLDDVRIYNCALSENEIKTLYNEDKQK